jgi:phosphohistidine swiveling domain-containing protein
MATAMNPTAFPVPADLNGFWMFDQVHGPRPLTPLSQEVILSALTEGFCAALREVGYPTGLCYRAVNNYAYCAFMPHAASDDVSGTSPSGERDAIASLMSSLGELWEREWLPSILPGLDRLRTADYRALPDGDLLATFNELRGDLVERWRIHGLLLFSYQAASTFDDLYKTLFDPVNPMEPYLLLNGFETRSFEATRALWGLSRVIRASPALLLLFQETAPSSLAGALAGSQEGRVFLIALRRFLDEYGWRGDAILELAEPMWREDLAIPLNAVQGLVSVGDDQDPDSRLQQIVDRRERLLELARARLTGEPVQLARFDALYEQARRQAQLDEDHNFYIDQMGNVALRLPILELGRRLVKHGSIEHVDDVFMLTCEAIAGGLADADQRELVGTRRAEMARSAGLTPPPTVGKLPPEGDPDPLMAALMKLDAPPAPQAHTATVIRGTPASPGTASGRAKVARSLEEASTVEQGQILVCEMTLPTWSVLFTTVGAVVADTGGVLSHCATIAREYGIPCVVGTSLGTSAIPDGAMLAVDGTNGEVHILEMPA